MPKVLSRLRIDEISAVDKGAGDGVKIVLVKRDPKLEKTMSFFTKLFARKAPADIHKSIAALAESVKSIVDDDSADKNALLGQTFDEFGKHLESVVAAQATDPGKTGEGGDIMSPEVLKALGLTESAKDEDVLKSIALLQKAKKKPEDEEEDDWEKKEKDKKEEKEEEDEEERKKTERAKMPEHLRKQLDEYDVLKAQVAKLRADAELESIKKIAAEALLPDKTVAILQKAYSSSTDRQAINELVGMLKVANIALQESDLLKELGATGRDQPVDAVSELTAKAAELRKREPSLTKEQAFTKVLLDPENAALAKRERIENTPRIG